MKTPLEAQECAEVLEVGARLLQAKFPVRRNVGFYAVVRKDPAEFLACGFKSQSFKIRCSARFEWPGVVVVVHEYDGREIARSLPGQPFTLDPKARP